MPERDWQKDFEFAKELASSPLAKIAAYVPGEILLYWLQRVRELEAQTAAMHELLKEIRACCYGSPSWPASRFVDAQLYKETVEEIEKALSPSAGKELLERVRSLEMAAKDALSLLRCKKEFPEDLCIKVGNVVRYERVVQGLERALAAMEGGKNDEW